MINFQISGNAFEMISFEIFFFQFVTLPRSPPLPIFLSLDLFPFEFSPTSIVFLSLLVGGYCSEFTSHSSPGRWSRSSRSNIDLPRWHPRNPSQVSYFIRIVEKLKDIAPFCSKGMGAICFVENWKLRVEGWTLWAMLSPELTFLGFLGKLFESTNSNILK